MRHNFVMSAKRDYDMPDGTIKYLIGHRPDSTLMETTYAHLSGDDHVARAAEAWGIREPEDESPHTPDAKATQEQLAADMKQVYRESDPVDPDTKEKIDKPDELLGDPEVKQALLKKLTR